MHWVNPNSMHGIYLMAVVTTVCAIGVVGPLIHRLQLPATERYLWLAALVVLPLQPLAFYFIRVPLDLWLVGHLGNTSATYHWLTSLYAPLTEEPAKLVPLLIPAIRRDIRPENFVRYALAIGLGFAIGEMWFVAERLARIPAYVGMPFYQFGGFFGERLMTCFFHSAFVAVALWRLQNRFALGFAGAVALHWLGNAPLQLMAQNAWGLGKNTWMVLVQLWLLFYFLACIALLAFLAFGRPKLGKMLFGIRDCPECHREYDAPLFGFNFGVTRYERCPHCRRWHWTGAREAK